MKTPLKEFNLSGISTLNLKVARYLTLADHISTWSKDPSTKVGAVLITLDGKVASTGYNGLPCSHDDSMVHDRQYKVEHIIHAEMNAIANRYIFDTPCIMFVSKPMCPDCAKLVTAHRFIKGVAWLSDSAVEQRWNSSKSISMLEKHFSTKAFSTGQYTLIVSNTITITKEPV